MGSRFATLFGEFAGPHLLDEFGERNDDQDAELAQLLLSNPALAGTAGEWFGVNFLPADGVSYQELFDAETPGVVIKRNAFIVDVLQTDLTAQGIDRLSVRMKAKTPDGEEWQVDLATSDWDKPYVRIGLHRNPKTHGVEARRGSAL